MCFRIPASHRSPYQTARGSLVRRFSGDLEGNIVRRGVLDFEGRGGGVVEVLGQELDEGEPSKQQKYGGAESIHR